MLIYKICIVLGV